VFYSKADAAKVMDVLPKRFGRFGLNLHPEKTRLIDFKRPDLAIGKVRQAVLTFLASPIIGPDPVMVIGL
jgi:hypothetical protein